MQSVRFSGTFTFNASDQQAAMAARLDCQRHIEKQREEAAFQSGGDAKNLAVSVTELVNGDKFYLRTAPSGTESANDKKDVDELDSLMKGTCNSRAIQYDYSASHKGLLGRLNERVTQAANSPTADKIAFWERWGRGGEGSGSN